VSRLPADNEGTIGAADELTVEATSQSALLNSIPPGLPSRLQQ